jgi:secreted trypsin-like serine protease
MSGRTLTQALALSATVLGLAACAPSTGSLKSADGLNVGIIGGKEATGTEDFAKTVVLLYDKEIGSICTASILSDKVLLTAAHCVVSQPTSLYVVFGTNIEATDIIVRRVVTATVTPVWTKRASQELNNGDMAMVGFIGGLPEGYKTAELLSDVSQLEDGVKVTLAGYGTSDGVKGTGAGKLRYVDTTIQTVGYTESEILMEQSKGFGACHGDSGGPAYVEIDGKRLVIGVTSRGVNDPDNHCGVSSAYTSVPFYADWIKETAERLTANVDKITEMLKQQQNKNNAAAAAGNKKPQQPQQPQKPQLARAS